MEYGATLSCPVSGDKVKIAFKKKKVCSLSAAAKG